jgi:hypothetical protein
MLMLGGGAMVGLYKGKQAWKWMSPVRCENAPHEVMMMEELLCVVAPSGRHIRPWLGK